MAVVKIHNEYECGRASNRTVHVRNPLPGERTSDWWDEVVNPETGDGHSCGSSEHAYYEATIEVIDDPDLRAGDTMTWEG